MQRRHLLQAIAAAISAAGLSRSAFGQAGGDIAIGAVYPMSGPSAQVGVDARHAYETGAAIVNGGMDLPLVGARHAGIASLGNAKLRIVMADHQGDPQKGRAEAERLITQEKVVAIVGAYQSSVASTVSVVCERYGVPFVVSDSSSPSLHRRGLKFFFRPAAHDEMFSKTMFDFLDAQRAAGHKIGTLGIFYEDTIFGTDSSKVQRALAAERGYAVACDVKFKANSPSLTAEAQQIKAADPDVFLPSCYTTDAIQITKTFAELGYKPRNILAQAAGFADKGTFDAVGDKLEGMISRAAFSLDLSGKRPFIATVNDMYKAAAGRDLNDNTSRDVTSILIIADALNRAGSTDGSKLRDALAATDIPGAQTIMPWQRISFGPDGQNMSADPVLIQYIGGKFVTVFPASAAVAPAKWPMNG